MNSLIYKNPIASSIILNLTGLIFISLLLVKGIYGSAVLALPIAIFNRIIIEYGVNMNYRRKLMIYLSVFIMVMIIMFFTLHIHKTKV